MILFAFFRYKRCPLSLHLTLNNTILILQSTEVWSQVNGDDNDAESVWR